MSERGACLDNAVAERFFGSVKGERLVHGRHATRQEARAAVVEYMEMFYNSKRLPAYLGYTSPNAYEAVERVA
jgi:transposase InsO family protein